MANFSRDGVTILEGSCLDLLPTLPADSVDCCVTSPPYWGLRDYGTATWEGGDPECSHRPDDTPAERGIESSTLGGGKESTGHRQEGFKGECPRCGAKRIDNQIGLEPTPEDYVSNMVGVFSEVRRVLKPAGTLWLNLGDTYNAYNGNRGASASFQAATEDALPSLPKGHGLTCKTLKSKDLVGIPWMVAFALRADGWYLRQDIIWHKPNPMPESVKDRCVKAHEYLFLLSKSARYHFDQEAILEPAAYAGQSRGGSKNRYEQNEAGMDCREYDTRTKRSVWTVQPASYKGAHFAVFPEELIDPCIRASCPEGGTVLDPFTGSGTTAAVAQKNGCKFIGCELNPEYVKLAAKRFRQRSLLRTD